jgi:hypothetical protein
MTAIRGEFSVFFFVSADWFVEGTAFIFIPDISSTSLEMKHFEHLSITSTVNCMTIQIHHITVIGSGPIRVAIFTMFVTG